MVFQGGQRVSNGIRFLKMETRRWGCWIDGKEREKEVGKKTIGGESSRRTGTKAAGTS